MAKSPVVSITITSDDKTKKGFDSATKNTGLFGKGLSKTGVALGSFAGNLAAQAVPALIGFGKEMFSLGGQLDSMDKKAGIVFGDEAADIRKWADGLNESLGISDERLVGLAANMGDLLIPMGFTRDAAAELTKTNIDAAGALAAWSGGQYDAAQVSEILSKALLGEREQLKGLGISINQAEVDRRALTIAQAEGRDEITAMDKALATQQLIMEKSTDAQTAWADGTQDAIKDQAKLSAMVDDAKASIARGLTPAIQGATRWIANELAPKVQQLVATFRDKWPQIRAAVEPVLTWFRETTQAVVEVVTVLWSTFGDTILELLRSTFENLMLVVSGAMDVIQGVIDTVLGVLTGDWGKAWDGIKQIFTGFWKIIQGIVKQAVARLKATVKLGLTAVSKIFGAAWDGIKSATGSAIDAVVGFVTGLPGRAVRALGSLASTLYQKGVDLIGGLATGVFDKWLSLQLWYLSLPGKVISAIGNVAKSLVTTGRNLIVGLWNGAIQRWNDVRAWLGGLARKVLGSIPNPARLLYEVGKKIISGLWDGMKAIWGNVSGWLGGLGKKIIGLKGPPSYDAKLLTGNGKLIMSGFLGGLKDGYGDVERFLASVAPNISGDVTGTLSAAGRAPERTGNSTGSTFSGTIVQNFPAGTRPEDVARANRRYASRNGNTAA